MPLNHTIFVRRIFGLAVVGLLSGTFQACSSSQTDGNASGNSPTNTAGSSGSAGSGTGASSGAGTGASSGAGSSSGTSGSSGTAGGTQGNGKVTCAEGYTCFPEPGKNVVWVMKNDGNINGPSCQRVCENALSQSCAYHACDDKRPVPYKDMDSFQPIAKGLGFECKKGGCWWPDAPANGLYLVSINTDDKGAKSCFFPTETELSCSTDPGNANCFGERYASVCPCVAKPLDEACQWECPPNNTKKAVWKTTGTSCVERVNYWRKRACEEGWVECPPAGLPPMAECTACHECANSEAAWDKVHGAHNSFKRCGELVQGEGGGATCADVIDSFVAERAPDENGVMRCQGHCGPILSPGCQTFFWGKDKDSNFHTLNWRSCNVEKCQGYCKDNPGECFTHETSPSTTTCDDPAVGKEPGPQFSCQ
jgi:hypothetical protein